MRIYVTGGTGYIGGALCARLVAAGHEVRALVRDTSDTSRLDELGVATFPGDLKDRVSLREGMSGADQVVHLAAELDFGAPAERMQAINVEGSENVASLAYKLGVGRFLAVSSVAALGGSPDDGSPADEEGPRPEPPMRYGRTKRAADRAIAQWARRGLAVDRVHPSLVYGPPGKKSGANYMLRTIALGRMPAVVAPGRLASWVHLDDVVDAMVRVIERAEPGRDYILAGEAMALRPLVDRVCELAGRKPPRLSLPLPVARVAGRVAGWAAKLRGRRPPFHPEQLASLSCHWNYDDSRAREELGWRPRGLDEGLPETVAYLLRQG